MSAAPADGKAEGNCKNESEKKQECGGAPAEQCEKEDEEKECKGGHEKGHCRKELQKAKEEIEKLKAEAEDLKRNGIPYRRSMKIIVAVPARNLQGNIRRDEMM